MHRKKGFVNSELSVLILSILLTVSTVQTHHIVKYLHLFLTGDRGEG